MMKEQSKHTIISQGNIRHLLLYLPDYTVYLNLPCILTLNKTLRIVMPHVSWGSKKVSNKATACLGCRWFCLLTNSKFADKEGQQNIMDIAGRYWIHTLVYCFAGLFNEFYK